MARTAGIRAARRVALALIAGPVFYLLASVIGALIPSGGSVRAGGPVTIHLVTGPIHYDFLLPLDAQTRARFAAMNDPGLPLEAPGAEWLVAGWGARDFYTTTGTYRDLSPRAVWRAATGDASVIRLGLAGPLTGEVPVRSIAMDRVTYDRLLDAILADFARDAAGRPIALDHPGFSDVDMFFEARGRFHLFRTCNTWIGRVLRDAGLRFGAWTPLPLSVGLAQRVHLGG
ncbi:MAG: TIGR02117 family protein [Rhodobacteraceae bacterium]|nr:MAG: TIGR02117 family protein [Paracoccaceae bacterium]